jgi:hypothetical protein
MIGAVWLLGQLLACNGDTNINALHPEISVAPPDALAFGEVVVFETGSQELYISNGGRAPLDANLAITGGEGTFGLSEDSHRVEAGETWTVNVTFSPKTYLDYNAVLTIASNDAESPSVPVALSGTGIYEPTPDIQLDAMSIDFGTVDLGDSDTRYLQIQNVGDASLQIGTMTQEGSGAFHLVSDPSRSIVAAGASLPVIVEYEPVNLLGDSGKLTIPSDDPDEPSVTVTLLGNGGGDYQYPVARISCPGEAEPPQWLRLDGSTSSDPLGGSLTYAWTLSDRPTGSQAKLDREDLSAAQLYTDIAGEYEVQLVVTSEVGVPSAPAKCVIKAIPKDALHVELTWDGPTSDLDLHIAEDSASLFDTPDDACFCNPLPSWGGAGTDDDAHLDLDDRSGYGPENINVLTPNAGKYLVRVHYFEDNSDSDVTATVRVYSYGVLVDTVTQRLSRDEVWEVGQVNWPDGTLGRSSADPAPATARACY